MSRQIQIRRGTAAEHNNFTGAIGEITMDTTKKTLRVHDGEKVGGNEIMSLNKFNSNMTNCLTEIPQDIKLELSSGVLTLKSGSKIYIPSGVSSGDKIFNNITLSTDITVDAQSISGQTMVFYDEVNGTARCDILETSCLSGTTSVADSIFYNTDDNEIDYYDGSNIASENKYSLPLAIVTVSSGLITSIDNIFNGIAYIGSTVFSLPGVKGLIPNGRNNDGSFNNISFTTNDIYVFNFLSTYTGNDVKIGISSLSINCDSDYVYNDLTNTNNCNYCIVGTLDVSLGIISNFQPKTVFNMIDYADFKTLANNISEIDNINNIVTTVSSDKVQNGYFKFNNGLIIQWGRTPTMSSQDKTVTLPTAFTSSNYSVVATMNFTGGTDHCSCHTLTTTSFKMHVAAGGYVYNFIAIGY